MFVVAWLRHYWGAACGAAVAEGRVAAQLSSSVAWLCCYWSSRGSAVAERRVTQLLLIVAWLHCCWSSRDSASIKAQRVAPLLRSDVLLLICPRAWCGSAVFGRRVVCRVARLLRLLHGEFIAERRVAHPL